MTNIRSHPLLAESEPLPYSATSKEGFTTLMTSDYEVTFILKPSLDEAATEASVQRVAESLTKLGGTIKSVEPLGRRRLTHEIKDLREGFYAVITFTADSSNIREFERQLSLNDEVLRHIVVRHEVKKSKKRSEPATSQLSPPSSPVPFA